MMTKVGKAAKRKQRKIHLLHRQIVAVKKVVEVGKIKKRKVENVLSYNFAGIDVEL